MIEIRGARLKLNMEQPDEGVFLIRQDNGAETRLAYIHRNVPGGLTAMLPDGLATGDFTVEVRNRRAGNKRLFTGVFSKILRVN